MSEIINAPILAIACLVIMATMALVLLTQTNRSMCEDIASLTTAASYDLASSLKYISSASAVQFTKQFDFPSKFKIDLTSESVTVTYKGNCPNGATNEVEHNVKSIVEADGVTSESICVKKTLEDCESRVTICDAKKEGCCEITPSVCGGSAPVA